MVTFRVQQTSVQINQGHQETASGSLSLTYGVGAEISDIGASASYNSGLRGDIYEILIWSRVLSDDEVDVVVAGLHDRYDLSP